jgi:integrase
MTEQTLALAQIESLALVTTKPELGRAIEDYFLIDIRNMGTRSQYIAAVRRLAAWMMERGLKLETLTPRDVALYVEEDRRKTATVRASLAAIRGLFDYFVEKGFLPQNPAARVATLRESYTEGKTPVITREDVRQLLSSIPDRKLIDARDRAIIGVLYFTLARSGAVVRLRCQDYMKHGSYVLLRLQEKYGKEFYAPVPGELAPLLDRYQGMACLLPGDPLFPSAIRGGRDLSTRHMHQNHLAEMLERRAIDAGLSPTITPHVLRATAITEFLKAGGRLENAQRLARHERIATTALYDRRQWEVAHAETWRLSLNLQT